MSDESKTPVGDPLLRPAGYTVNVGPVVDPLRPPAKVLVAVGSLVVHLLEGASPNGHPLDAIAANGLRERPEVRDWFDAMGDLGLLPVRRDGKGPLG